MRETIIKLKHIGKKYVVHHEKPTLVENIFKRKKTEEFYALRDINLTVFKGDSVGIFGANGSGKTTLLKIMAGITTPTYGSILCEHKIISLIELGAGFHPDLTGEENIFLNGLLLGMDKNEIVKKLKSITTFADIGGFIDAPLYTYSDGMKLRISFAIAIHASPEVLILDENISVGDNNFKQKSLDKINEFRKKRKTIIIATHSFELLKKICNRAIWLFNGEIRAKSTPKGIIRLYEKEYNFKYTPPKKK